MVKIKIRKKSKKNLLTHINLIRIVNSSKRKEVIMKQLVPQWFAKGDMAQWLLDKKQEHGSITAYIRSLIINDMKKKK